MIANIGPKHVADSDISHKAAMCRNPPIQFDSRPKELDRSLMDQH